MSSNDLHLHLREALMQILPILPPQQRAVIVLRYWEQLSQAETAAALGCSEGTVKSAASRGLERMRDLASPAHITAPGHRIGYKR